MGNIERLTFMESKILEMGRKQYDRGFQGGTFTPGFIRKETEYGYRAINVALESLIASGLVEKTVTNTFRNGSLVELDVYKITDKGVLALGQVESGAIKIDGREPSVQRVPKPEPRAYSKPWEKPKPRFEERPVQDFSQQIKALETTIKAMAEDMRNLHAKVDRVLAREQPAQAPASAEPARQRPRALSPEATAHRVLILGAVKELEKRHDHVLAGDVKDMYVEQCTERGIPPKGLAQFTPFLKRLEGEGILSLRRTGCKNLGIKGHGSRVVVSMTPEGRELLGRNA